MGRWVLMTGGGDCPGLNAILRAVVLRADALGHTIVGASRTFHGLLEPGGTRALSPADVDGWLGRGGTMLGTSNRADPFRFPVKTSEGWSVQDVSRRVIDAVQALGADGVVSVGGDGSLQIAARLAQLGLPIIGVPKSIDNDLAGSDLTTGYDTARQLATEAVERLHDTAASHDRVMVLELMGRDAGYLSLEAGLAGGAHAILLPELPWRPEVLRRWLQQRLSKGHRHAVIVVAEGARVADGERSIVQAAGVVAGRGQPLLGGAGQRVAEALADPDGPEVRVTVLGHIQRGGMPSAADRLLATRLGLHAATLAHEGRWNRMVALRGTEVIDRPLDGTTAATRQLATDDARIVAARQLGICLGDGLDADGPA